MLRRIRVQNFMSLRDATVDFEPLTIFIGPNAAGKSAIFKALVTVSKLLGPTPVTGPYGDFQLEPGATFDHLVWQGNSGLPIIFHLWWSDDPDDLPGYTLELRKEARGWSVARERLKFGDRWFDSSKEVFRHETERATPKSWIAPYRATLYHLARPFLKDQVAAPAIAPLVALKEQFGEVRRYRISPASIAAFAKPPKGQRSDELLVRDDGYGLSLELQRLQGKNRRLFGTIERELSQVFPHIRTINPQSERYGVGLAFATDRSEDLVPASQESDGVLLATFFLWRLYTASPELTICLEEPENGVHPYLLAERYRLFGTFAHGESGRPPVQLLVATHSPDFLTAIENSQEALTAIRIVEFSGEEGTTVHKLNRSDEMEVLLDAFHNNLGELWWSGALGARPSIRGDGS